MVEVIRLLFLAISFAIGSYVYEDLSRRRLSRGLLLVVFFVSVVLADQLLLDSLLLFAVVFLGMTVLSSSVRPLTYRVFEGLLPFLGVDLSIRIFDQFIFPAILYVEENRILPVILALILLLLVLPSYHLIKALFHLDYQILRHSQSPRTNLIVNLLNTLFICYYVLIYGGFLDAFVLPQELFLIVYTWVLFIALSYLNRLALKQTKNALQLEKERHLRNLNTYSRYLEDLYQILRTFKHDHENILLSLRESVEAGDLSEISSVYQEVVVKSTERLPLEQDLIFSKLLHLDNMSLKVTLTKHLLAAQKAGIAVKVSINTSIDSLPISQDDYQSLLEELLPSAIALTKSSRQPFLVVKLYRTLKEDLLTITCRVVDNLPFIQSSSELDRLLTRYANLDLAYYHEADDLLTYCVRIAYCNPPAERT